MIPPHVQAWDRCDDAALRGVVGILTDIDDTLTTEGAITMGVAAALAALGAAGVPVIAVTGRPLGWSLPLVEQTPLAAIVAENGAVLLRRVDGATCINYAQGDDERTANAARLATVAARIVHDVPGACLARDSAGRVTDIAVDHAEFNRLDAAAVARVVAIMERAGMQATISSIHVNGWFGAHDKRSGAAWAVDRLLGRNLEAERARWIYIGDSTNDQRMFAAFALSVGVANLGDFAAQLTQWPTFITKHERGRGFVEVAEAVLAARGA